MSGSSTHHETIELPQARPVAPPPPPPVVVRRPAASRWLLWALALALAVATGVALWQTTAASAARADLQAVEQRLAEVEQELASLRADNRSLQEQNQALKAAIDELRADANAPRADGLDELSGLDMLDLLGELFGNGWSDLNDELDRLWGELLP